MGETIKGTEKKIEEYYHIEELPEKLQEKMARNLIFGILDSEVKYLSSPEISEIINKAIDREDASESLISTIRAFSEKLAGQEIAVKPANNVEEVLHNTTMCLFAFTDRARKQGMEERYEKIIREGFHSIEGYINLLMNHSNFEKAELGGRFGFLKEFMTDKEIIQIMTQKSAYIKRCKEILEGEEEKVIDH